jgi:hypothetical protein
MYRRFDRSSVAFLWRQALSSPDFDWLVVGKVQKLSCIADFFALSSTMETKPAELKVPLHIRDLPLDHARHAVPIGTMS